MNHINHITIKCIKYREQFSYSKIVLLLKTKIFLIYAYMFFEEKTCHKILFSNSNQNRSAT